jgi:Peptidase_G2, IMC autoproteolytic cleavage domain
VIIGGGPNLHGHGLQVQTTGMSNFSGSVTVAGTLTAGTVYANYQDVAEWVPATETMPAGTVVVVSDDGDNTVTASTRAYDSSVAGVVSPNPGLLLGIAGASKAKIATTGRVRVRVDATKSPIRKGDLLVTSDRPGMAMKSEPLDVGGAKLHRPGTLIGKALEPLDRGEGEILVLLSLQ